MTMCELVKLLKLIVCVRSYALMVHISVFIRPQTNRIQGHQIINSTKFPPTPTEMHPSYISSLLPKTNIPVQK